MSEIIEKRATLSDCGLYRFLLTRAWGDGPTALFIMLNPSTADADVDDPTIRRCMSFARRERCGGLLVANLFAYRATDPRTLALVDDPIGVGNDGYIFHALSDARGPVIAAWGAHAMARERFAEMFPMWRSPLQCLGKTKAGAPRHPLYVRGDAPLIPFP